MNVFQDRLAGGADHLQRDDPVATHQQPELREPKPLKLRARRPHAPELEHPGGQPPTRGQRNEATIRAMGHIRRADVIDGIDRTGACTTTVVDSSSPPEQPVNTARTTTASPHTTARPVRPAAFETPQVMKGGGGESACRRDSVREPVAGVSLDDHPSLRSTRECLRTGRPLPARSCSEWGLPSRSGRPERWCALTAPFHPCRPFRRWSVLCGTFLRVASTGC